MGVGLLDVLEPLPLCLPPLDDSLDVSLDDSFAVGVVLPDSFADSEFFADSVFFADSLAGGFADSDDSDRG